MSATSRPRSHSRGFLLAVIALAIGNPAEAHDPGLSTVQGVLKPAAIELTTGFAPDDAQELLAPADRLPGRVTDVEFEQLQPRLAAIAPHLWVLTVRGTVVPPQSVRVELLPGDNVSFTTIFSRGAGDDPIVLRADKLGVLPNGHRQFVILSDEAGVMVARKLLSAKDPVIETPGRSAPADTPTSEDPLPTFGEFLWLGVEHIWKGYDHLLFLFALLIVCRSFRSIVAIISCFTIAHSITLALATLDVVNLPGRMVEPAIAASIVFVGVENLLRRGAEPRGRWVLTFVFGLIHGFGFASVLRDLGVGGKSQGIAMPLFSFNLGVELGQIAIAAVILPLFWRARKHENFARWGVPVISAGVAIAGAYWLLERTVFA